MAQEFGSFDDLQAALAALPPDEQLSLRLTPELAQDILNHDPVNRKIRPANVQRLVREINGGHWDPRKSTAMRFLLSKRLGDGQHRCKAVIETGIPITVPCCLVSDTIGIDEGAGRTLVDHLQLSFGFDEHQATLASAVTKALNHVGGAGNREFLDFFKENELFIRECVNKPAEWLADQEPVIAKIFKPVAVAVMRARAIRENQEPAESVDQLLNDAINGGATAPEGSPRRALSKQYFDAMSDSFQKRTKRPEAFRWLLNALKAARDGQIKNITTMRIAKKSKTKKKQGSKIAA
jgi:hypothetical protein